MRDLENNQVELMGEIINNFQYSHDVFGEGFYVADLSVMRDSGRADVLPIMVSERLVDIKSEWTGITVRVSGQFRSYNKHEGRKNRLILSVFVRKFEQIEEDDFPFERYVNRIFLEGNICKEPAYRKTPTEREICDVLLAVNRDYGKSDYIPLILWGRNAKFASTLSVGNRISVYGRIQSRTYQKQLSETEIETRTAYEVSVQKLKA